MSLVKNIVSIVLFFTISQVFAGTCPISPWPIKETNETSVKKFARMSSSDGLIGIYMYQLTLKKEEIPLKSFENILLSKVVGTKWEAFVATLKNNRMDNGKKNIMSEKELCFAWQKFDEHQ